MKQKVCAILILMLFIFTNVSISLANTPYVSYNYDFRMNPVPCPPPYLPAYTITGEDLKIGSFMGPSDFFIGPDGNNYILDSGNNRIVVTDREWKVLKEIKSFKNASGAQEKFLDPRGIFVTEKGEMYIADYGNERAVVIDKNQNLVLEINKEDPAVKKVIKDEFKVSKIVADKSGRMYLIAEGIMDGVMEFYNDGYFSGFIGANKVTPSIADYFWKRLASKDQKEAMIKFIPEQFSNINIDDNGFIFTTTAAVNLSGVVESANTDSQQTLAPIRKLNPAGDNILRRVNPNFPQTGDYYYPDITVTGYTKTGPSSFVDVTVEAETGIYNVLDNRRGRVFSYDEDGNLLYVFSGWGNQVGLSMNPVAIEYSNDQIYILDKNTSRITVFDLTTYGRDIKKAITAHTMGEYDKAAEYWGAVKKLNANYDLAYVGVGKSLHRQGNYKEAMKNFKLGNNRLFYSKSFKLYRKAIVQNYFSYMVIVFFSLMVLTLILKGRKTRKVRKGLNV